MLLTKWNLIAKLNITYKKLKVCTRAPLVQSECLLNSTQYECLWCTRHIYFILTEAVISGHPNALSGGVGFARVIRSDRICSRLIAQIAGDRRVGPDPRGVHCDARLLDVRKARRRAVVRHNYTIKSTNFSKSIDVNYLYYKTFEIWNIQRFLWHSHVLWQS